MFLLKKKERISPPFTKDFLSPSSGHIRTRRPHLSGETRTRRAKRDGPATPLLVPAFQLYSPAFFFLFFFPAHQDELLTQLCHRGLNYDGADS